MIPLLAAAAALALALAAQVGQPVLAGVIVVVQAVIAFGARRRADVPLAETSTWLGFVGAALTTVLILLLPATSVSEFSLTPMLPVLGIGLIGMVLVQLNRQDGRPRLVESLSYAVGVLLLAMLPASWLSVAGVADGALLAGFLLVVSALALALQALPWHRAISAAVGVGAALLAGAWLTVGTDVIARLTELTGPVAAATTAAAAVIGLFVGERVSRDRGAEAPPADQVTGRADALLAAAVPMAFAGPVAYLMLWLFA